MTAATTHNEHLRKNSSAAETAEEKEYVSAP